MNANPFTQYLVWRREHLEQLYWRLTSTVRLSGIVVFGLLMAASALLFMRFREDMAFGTLFLDVLGTSVILVGGALMLALVAALSVHAAARFRRLEVLDELEILYQLPSDRPKPSAEWDSAHETFTPVERQHS